jgi:hypothetical protein
MMDKFMSYVDISVIYYRQNATELKIQNAFQSHEMQKKKMEAKAACSLPSLRAAGELACNLLSLKSIAAPL